MKPDLTSRRVWLIGGGVLALLVIVCSFFFVIRPQLDDAQTLAGQTSSTLETTQELQARIAELQHQRGKISQYVGTLRHVIDALPFDSGLPAFTRQLTAQAAQQNVKLTGISVGGISALAAPVTTTAPDATSSASASPSPSPTSTDAAADPSAAPVAGAVQAGATYEVQVTVSTTGTLADQLSFLKTLQYGGSRPALITSTELTASTPGSNDGGIHLTSQLVLFSSPQTPERVAQLNKLLQAASSG